RTGTKRIRGAQQLDIVTTMVHDNPNAPWRPVRRWQLDYEPINCNGSMSPRRQLNHVFETGAPDSPSAIAGPTLTFTYGPQRDFTNITDVQLRNGALDKTGRSWGPIGPIYSMLMDIDGDHLPDQVVTLNGGNPALCQAGYYKNLGNGTFATTPVAFNLPNLPSAIPPDWQPPGGNSIPQTEAQCTPAGFWVAGFGLNDNQNVCRPAVGPRFMELGAMIRYRWVDVDGDGYVDLVTGEYHDTGILNTTRVWLCGCPDPAHPPCADPSNPEPGCCDPNLNPCTGFPDHDYVDCNNDLTYVASEEGCPADPAGNPTFPWKWYRNVPGPNGTRTFDLSSSQQFCSPTPIAEFTNVFSPSMNPGQFFFEYTDVTGDGLPDIVPRPSNNSS